jgi:hypothetical protein
MRDRADIAAALEQVDSRTRAKLTGHPLKKLVGQLSAIQGTVLGLAEGTLPRVNKTDGAGFGDTMRAAKPRLLVLTDTSFWIFETRSSLGIGGGSGIEIKLARIQDDVRLNTFRRKSEFGRATRLMSFDHLRGSSLETESFDLNRDEQLVAFTDRFNEVLDQQRTAALEERDHQEVERFARATQAADSTSPSTADELEKLGKLLEKGLLTPDEFAEQKKRLLGAQ